LGSDLLSIILFLGAGCFGFALTGFSSTLASSFGAGLGCSLGYTGAGLDFNSCGLHLVEKSMGVFQILLAISVVGFISLTSSFIYSVFKGFWTTTFSCFGSKSSVGSTWTIFLAAL